MSSSINRAFAVLKVICESSEPLRFSDVARRAAMPKSTVNRLLGALQALEMVRLEEADRCYRPGYALLSLATNTWAGLGIREAAAGEMQSLLDDIQETIHLAVLDGCEIMYIDKLESAQTIRLFSAIGKRGPIYCTGVGKAILAFMDSEHRERIIAQLDLVPHTPHTRVSRSDLLDDLAATRQRGWALDIEEHEEGIRCVAAPIFNFRGEPVASISITSAASRMGEDRISNELAPRVLTAAGRISRALGNLGPDQKAVDK